MTGEAGNKVNLPDSHVDDQQEISASNNETYVMRDHYTEHTPLVCEEKQQSGSGLSLLVDAVNLIND